MNSGKRTSCSYIHSYRDRSMEYECTVSYSVYSTLTGPNDLNNKVVNVQYVVYFLPMCKHFIRNNPLKSNVLV